VAVSAHDATLNRDNALHHIQGLNSSRDTDLVAGPRVDCFASASCEMTWSEGADVARVLGRL